MKGYLNRPHETADSIDREGWYHTGDVGYVDDEDFFFIVDRTKELIKYKGLQVAPAELEALLLTHPAVLDAAVIRPELIAIPVPGHTRGSAAFLLESRFLFSGDSLYWSRRQQDLGAFRDACWYSWEAQADSLERLAERMGAGDV